jgi:hypothetical protein
MKNIYIENDKEIKAICAGGNDEGLKYDLGIGLTIFDQRHGQKHDIKRAAEYKQYLGVPMSVDEQNALK